MSPIRRLLPIVLLTYGLTWLGSGSAQGDLRDTHAGDPRGAAVFDLLLNETDLVATWFPPVAGLLAEGLQRIAPLPRDQVVPEGLCAHLVGTGGTTPRLDGGGDLLSAVGGIFQDTRRVEHAWRYRIGTYEHEGPSLIIVDEFSLEGLAVALQRYVDVGVNARIGTFDPLWQATYGYRVALRGTTPEATDVPHGHLVAYHALSQLPSGTRVAQVRMPTDDRVEVRLWHDEMGSMTVHFVAMRFDEPETIEAALDEAARLGPAAVVLSWGIVACDLALRYDQVADPAQYPTIGTFLLAALRAEAEAFVDLTRQLCAAFEEARPGVVGVATCEDAEVDELLGLAPIVAIAGYGVEAARWFDPGTSQTYFAAAGNQGLAIPMAPAAWRGVVGVEACARDLPGSSATQRAPFSNAGGVGPEAAIERALGAWFASPVERTDDHADGEPKALGYWGTSFAAPSVALRSLDVTGRWAGAADCR